LGRIGNGLPIDRQRRDQADQGRASNRNRQNRTGRVTWSFVGGKRRGETQRKTKAAFQEELRLPQQAAEVTGLARNERAKTLTIIASDQIKRGARRLCDRRVAEVESLAEDRRSASPHRRYSDARPQRALQLHYVTAADDRRLGRRPPFSAGRGRDFVAREHHLRVGRGPRRDRAPWHASPT
jgi:hypothetical protein